MNDPESIIPTTPRNDLQSITDRIIAKAQARAAEFAPILASAPPAKTCPTCGGVATLDRQRSEDFCLLNYGCAACAATAAAEAIRQVWARAGIPSDVLHADFENFDTKREPRDKSDAPARFVLGCRAFAGGTPRNLIMAGTVGIGKGHLAAAIAKDRMATAGDYSVQWWNCHKLFEASHRAYENGDRQRMIDRLADVSLLILDEVAFAELPKDGGRLLYDIIDGRQKNRRQTLLLSNRPAVIIREWLGAAAVDRLRSGGAAFLWGDWESARGTKIEGGQF